MVLGALVLIATIILPVLFGAPRGIEGQSGGDPWRNIIFDFQTLLTGLLAVGAATWTVMTMERTDRAAERRHQELVKLSLRADRLRVERMLYPGMLELQVRFTELADVQFDVLESKLESDTRDVSAVLRRMIKVVHEVRDILRSDVFVSARDLFDGLLTAQDDDLMRLYQSHWAAANRCFNSCQTLFKAVRTEDRHYIGVAKSEASELMARLREDHERLVANFSALLRSLEDMREEYGIHSTTP